MPSVVVDASVVVPLFIRGPASAPAQAVWTAWEQSGTDVEAPTLLVYEVTNGLHRAAASGVIPIDRLAEGLDILADFPIIYHPPLRLAARAVQITRDLKAGATYDGFYLALAESLRCDFWTGDRRLYHNTRRMQSPSVRSIWER